MKTKGDNSFPFEQELLISLKSDIYLDTCLAVTMTLAKLSWIYLGFFLKKMFIYS